MRDWKRRDGQQCKVGKGENGKKRHRTAGLENTRRATKTAGVEKPGKACMDRQMLLVHCCCLSRVTSVELFILVCLIVVY